MHTNTGGYAMKIQNITDVEKFFSVIDQCRGTLVAHEKEDIERLIKYMYQGE